MSSLTGFYRGFIWNSQRLLERDFYVFSHLLDRAWALCFFGVVCPSVHTNRYVCLWVCVCVCAYVHVRVSVGLCVRLCRGAKVEKSLNFGLLWLQWKKKALQAESLLEKVPAHSMSKLSTKAA